MKQFHPKGQYKSRQSNNIVMTVPGMAKFIDRDDPDRNTGTYKEGHRKNYGTKSPRRQQGFAG